MFKAGQSIETPFGYAIVSFTGYKKDSKDVNNALNLIPSNVITMKGVEFKVVGVDDLGDVIMMEPEKDYIFKGRYVIEIPVKHR